MMIPTYGQTILIGQLVRGETPDYGFMALSCLATTIVAMALLVVAARLYNRENMAFAN